MSRKLYKTLSIEVQWNTIRCGSEIYLCIFTAFMSLGLSQHHEEVVKTRRA